MKYAKLINSSWSIISIPTPTNTLIVNNRVICNPSHQTMIDKGYIEFDDTIPEGYRTTGYEVVDGKLKYTLTEIPASEVPAGWPYPDRKIRITTPISLASESQYQNFFTKLSILRVPFTSDSNNETVTYYFEELKLEDGFSLTNGAITHLDTRLTIESFGSFEVVDNVIISSNV